MEPKLVYFVMAGEVEVNDLLGGKWTYLGTPFGMGETSEQALREAEYYCENSPVPTNLVIIGLQLVSKEPVEVQKKTVVRMSTKPKFGSEPLTDRFKMR